MQTFPQMSPARGNQFVNDFSAGDFSDQMGLVTANGNMTIEFFHAMIRIEDPLDPSVNGTFKTRLCVRKRPHGDRLTEAVRFISEQQAMQLYPREYAWFKQNRDVPTDGTPLAELPGITQSQISILVLHNIRSIEDLTGLHADQIGQIGMEARAAHALAQRWTEARNANGDLIRDAAQDAATKAELDRLRESETRQAATITAMQAQLDLLTRMGVQLQAGGPATIGGTPSVGIATAADKPVLIDADGMGDDAPASEMFTGAQMVTGNDDLNADVPPPSLPGLDRRKR